MAAETTIQIFRGLEADIPALGDGEPGFTTDSHKLFVGQGGVNFEIGNSVLTGTGAPDPALGVAGNVYLDMSDPSNPQLYYKT